MRLCRLWLQIERGIHGRSSKTITELNIRRWQRERPASAQACGGGLYFRAKESGANQWNFRYYRAGRARWVPIGTYPDKSLAEARRDARSLRVALDEGRDVAEERRAAKRDESAARTVSELANDWYASQVESRLKAPQVVRRRIDRHIVPVIGAILLKNVGPGDVDAVLRRAKKKYPATASNALCDMRKMFRFARKRGMMDSNPAADFDISDAGGTPVSRDRYLSDSEVRNLFSAMTASPSFTRPNELAVRLLLALCVRKMELLAAQWDAFDLENGLWTLSETKTGTAIVIPLAEPVIGWLREVKVFSVGSDYLFPARRVTKKKRFGHVSPDTLNLALKQLPIDIEPFTVHDFRRTARTHLSALGVAPDIAERSLNHKISGGAWCL